MITTKNLIYIISGIMASLFAHEIGHVIALWMLGNPAYIEFAIISFGPVFRTKWTFALETFDIWFVAFCGPFFAGIVFMLIGKIKSEAYIAGEIQLIWAPFELMTRVLRFNNGDVLGMYILLFIMVVIPLIFVLGWGFDRVDKCNK